MSAENVSMNVQQQQQDTFERVTEEASTEAAPAQEQQVRLVDVPVQNDNVALNLMAAFLNMANRRGAFSLEESAKIHECVKHFTRAAPEGEAPAQQQ